MRNFFTLVFALLLNTACGGGDAADLGSGGAGSGGVPGTGGQQPSGGAGGSGGAGTGGGLTTGGTGSGGVGSGGLGSGGLGSGGVGTGGGASGGGSGATEWLPAWATTIQRTESANKPTTSLPGKTLRQFVWPTVSGSEIRVQFSNERGNGPVDIAKAHVASAKTAGDPNNSNGDIDATTDVALTFGGMPNVTIPVGEAVWSDAVAFPLTEITLTAISLQFGATVPSDITGHPGARTTSYIADGDVVSLETIPDVETRERWYFINAIEVMAPADAFAIALLGDSITDGYGTINDFSRWSDFLTRELKTDPLLAATRSVLNFGMGGNTLTGSVGGDQDPGLVRFQRDVLPRDKIKWLIVLEGVNDITNGTSAQTLMDAYDDIISQAEAEGIEVFISPLTPMNGATNSGTRTTLNPLIRSSANYSVGADLDLAIRDPNNEDATQAPYMNDMLHPSKAGYQAMGESIDLMLFYP